MCLAVFIASNQHYKWRLHVRHLYINDIIGLALIFFFSGDTAALLSIGWSWKRVLILQLLVQVPAFLGLFIGVPVAEKSETAQQWFLIIAAGLFIYVALSDIVPELIAYFKAYHKLPMAICMNMGLGLGFLIMFLLAAFEGNIQV